MVVHAVKREARERLARQGGGGGVNIDQVRGRCHTHHAKQNYCFSVAGS